MNKLFNSIASVFSGSEPVRTLADAQHEARSHVQNAAEHLAKTVDQKLRFYVPARLRSGLDPNVPMRLDLTVNAYTGRVKRSMLPKRDARAINELRQNPAFWTAFESALKARVDQKPFEAQIGAVTHGGQMIGQHRDGNIGEYTYIDITPVVRGGGRFPSDTFER